ncbi:MAG: hypothetical protein JXO72_16675 [Vicinamibacteria bacterium]|nr:hypothetical protein [Vicinamibacteria bacterium]
MAVVESLDSFWGADACQSGLPDRLPGDMVEFFSKSCVILQNLCVYPCFLGRTGPLSPDATMERLHPFIVAGGGRLDGVRAFPVIRQPLPPFYRTELDAVAPTCFRMAHREAEFHDLDRVGGRRVRSDMRGLCGNGAHDNDNHGLADCGVDCRLATDRRMEENGWILSPGGCFCGGSVRRSMDARIGPYRGQ